MIINCIVTKRQLDVKDRKCPLDTGACYWQNTQGQCVYDPDITTPEAFAAATGKPVPTEQDQLAFRQEVLSKLDD